MAFSETQKTQIRRYLGYPDVYRQANTRLESAIEVVGSRPETQTLIEADLASLATIEAKLSGSVLSSAGVKKVDEIEFFQNGSLSVTRQEGRRICGRLSITFGVPIASDVFSSMGYQGDAWMHNIIPMG